ncbi:NDR1/HIN1-like protein 13 [Tripterygium wilfordii]|uniref:NDR1/HIN1-like protein 13 n=1 Tax=Tripterygium wilfordii TaxID=458696 RepID=UPI0018F84731|nr:NDR1/HIN1-like protein 13 [Tripterygium wilfordii]
MADRVYPSAKPPTTNTTATPMTANPAFPATKAQLYGASRPPYRPQPNHRRHRRGCCCSCCLWTTFIIIALLVLIAVAGAVLYVIYRPHRPSFTVSGLKVSSLNLTSSSKLVSNINLNITTRNPNKNLVYIYNPTTISVTTDDGIDIGTGSIPSFKHGTKNITLLTASITSNTNQALDDASAKKLRSDLKTKSGVPLKIKLETKVKVKIGGVKSPKVRIRVTCDGIKATAPTGKAATMASTSNAKCKVDLRFKIWKWTF